MADHAYLEEQEYGGKLSWHVWKRLLLGALMYRRFLIPLAIVAILTAGFDAAFTLVTRQVIDLAVSGERAGMAIYVWAYFGVTLGIVLCIWAFIILAGRISTGVSHDIRRDAFAKLQELSFSYYDRRPVGWLMSRLTSDCQRLSGILSWGLLDVVWGVSLMIGIVAILLWLNWKLALIVFSVLPLLVWVSVRFQRKMLRSSRQVRKINSQITAGYNEGIMAARTTKTLVREQANLQEFSQLSGAMFHSSVRNAVQSSLYLPIVITIGSVGTGLAIWFGGLDAMAGVISLGTLVAFITYTAQFFSPIHELARVFSEMQYAQASAERVLDLLDTEPEITDSPQVVQAIREQSRQPAQPGIALDGYPERIQQIEFRNISFAYKDGQPVLKDFNLTVQAGQTIALVGPTGGGKTTVVSLLCRFYEPTAGEILIDGTDYRRRSLHWLQSNLGIVLQSPHLFSGTIRENIRYGNLRASEDDIVRAATLVSAHEFITSMEKGYDAQVGEGGGRLSTGQKQLISFARAILANPQVFVMDEATSSVDTHTEQLIHKGMGVILKGRTSFVIAHRLSTIRSADRILVIDAGQIAEQGTHHELLLLQGRYFELYTNQFTREKEAEILEEIT